MAKGPRKPVRTRPADWSELSLESGPTVFARICPERERRFYTAARYGQMDVAQRRVFQIRGRKVVRSRMAEEIGAAIGLPDDVAGNSHAMSECVADVYVHHPAREFVFVIVDAQAIPALDYWVRVMADAGEGLQEPIEQGGWFDRSALPFHCVLEVSSDDELRLVAREVWRELGEQEPVPILGPSPFVRDDHGWRR